MTCDLDQLSQDACASGIADASERKLLVLIAQILCTSVSCDLDTVLAQACSNGFDQLNEKKLWVIITQLLCNNTA